MNEPLIVVTGAAGMIGSCAVRHLNDLGHRNLLLVDDLEQSDKWKNLLGKSFVDLISRHALFAWLQGREDEVDAILHLGACSDTTEMDGDYLLENNYRYTIRLAAWAVNAKKRFIYASSAATYGDGSAGFLDSEESLLSLTPLNRYGFSKHLADLWMQREGIFDRVVGLKYFNVFGPNECHKGPMASMVFKMSEIANTHGVIELFKSNDPRFSDGGQQRDFIYVKDVVRMTCALLHPNHRNISGLFNIGRGQPTTWNELAHALFKALNKTARIEYIDMPAALSKQYQNYTCACMRKWRTIFPVEQMTPIEDAVCEYVQKYLIPDVKW